MTCSLRYFLFFFILTIIIPKSLAGIITPGVVVGEGGTGSINRITRPLPINEFQVSKTFTKLAPIDISFRVDPGTNPLELYNFTERIVNNTGSKWFDFHLELGIGTGDDFRVIDTTTNLLFTHVTIPSECTTLIPDFNVVLGGSGQCNATPFGGTFSSTRPSPVVDFITTSPNITAQNAQGVETGHQLNVNFEIRVPNGINEFTLRETPTTDGKVLPPTISEPGTLAIVSLGLVALGVVQRKKIRAKNKSENS